MIKKENVRQTREPIKKTQNKQKINKEVPRQPKTKAVPVKIPIVFKIGTVAVIIGIAIFAFLKSPFFNIEEINVKIDHNTILTETEIKELSNIVVGQNMFSISKKGSIENIETNSYVESVKIKRKVPNKIEIEVIERTIAFQIQLDGAYAYVDNYGVVIDQKNEKKDCVIITGHKTENIVIYVFRMFIIIIFT